MPPIDFNRRTALYRFFDGADQLMYVGVAFDPAERWKNHAAMKPWWCEVERKVVEWHQTRTDALIAEASAIRAEQPLYNLKGSDLPRGGQSASHPEAKAPRPRLPRVEVRVAVPDREWETYADLCRDKGISRPTGLRMHIKRVVEARRRRLADS